MPRDQRIVIVGAGIGGLVAAALLANRGAAVTVIERMDGPGGKLRTATLGGQSVDLGPTVFTLRDVFDAVFAEAGSALEEHVTVRPLDILARHAWSEDETLDLFADIERSVEAIGDFAGAEAARGYRAFCDRSRWVHDQLERTFMRAPKTGPLGLAARTGIGGLSLMGRVGGPVSLWTGLAKDFQDPRLRQLFGRYATYCGSSPFDTPAIMMLVAHVEQKGVWAVDGGMHALARAVESLARSRGARFRYGEGISEIRTAQGRVSGVVTASEEELPADAVVLNGDVAALADGLLGPAVRHAVPAVARRNRSLSAMAWGLSARARGFPLIRHNVFFCRTYEREFDDIFRDGRLPTDPTVYVCAQARLEDGPPNPGGAEPMLCLVNAPPRGDHAPLEDEEIRQCETAMLNQLRRCGLDLRWEPDRCRLTTPNQFAELFPATGGALYGRAAHGWTAAFQRPGSRSRVPGLYLAGGSVHPSAGVPMAALSGRLAAERLMADHGST